MPVSSNFVTCHCCVLLLLWKQINSSLVSVTMKSSKQVFFTSKKLLYPVPQLNSKNNWVWLHWKVWSGSKLCAGQACRVCSRCHGVSWRLLKQTGAAKLYQRCSKINTNSHINYSLSNLWQIVMICWEIILFCWGGAMDLWRMLYVVPWSR